MLKKRVIPVILLEDSYIVKTINFTNPKYIGDPINAVRIFNEKEVDELIIIDINATKNKSGPDFKLINELATECFMPLTYGGGITKIEDIKNLFYTGIEKVTINHACTNNFHLIKEASKIFGSQSIIYSIDIIRKNKQYFIYDYVNKTVSEEPYSNIIEAEKNGAGELFLNIVSDDGAMSGYDIDFFKYISNKVSIPIIACGGAGSIDDIIQLFDQTDVSAAAAGSLFVYKGKHKAVLITYPKFN